MVSFWGCLVGFYLAFSSVSFAQAPSTLFQEIRELGRAKSALLVEEKPQVAANGLPKANLTDFKRQIGPLLKKACTDCHGPETTEGNLRVDVLNPDLLHGPNIDKWLEIFGVLSNGEMPPGDESEHELTAAGRAKIVDWLAAEIQKASTVRRNEGEHSSVRRLTKYEYNYALQDLLGLPYEFAENLPPETISEDGFKNSSEMLQMSAMQFQTYQEIGLQALRKATVRGERPEPITYIISMPDELAKQSKNKKAKTFHRDDKGYQSQRRRSHLFDRRTGQGVEFSGATYKPNSGKTNTVPAESSVALVMSGGQGFKLNLGNHLPDEGIMRVRVRAGRTTMNPEEYASLRLIFGAHTSNNANFSQTVSKRDLPIVASVDDPQFIDFEIPLSEIPRNPFRKNKTTFPRRDELLTIQVISNARRGNGDESLYVHLDHVEISAPYYKHWPPESHRRVFIDSENKADEQQYAREVLTQFLERVWCRSVTSEEVNQFVGLFNKHRPEFDNLEDAMLEVFATALATPEFLYRLEEKATSETDQPLSDLELAKRISFFLWSSIPDEELSRLAEQGQLSEVNVLRSQVERMLDDPRADRFAKHFVGQWLGLDGLENAVHVRDPDLKQAMAQEPIAFFNEILSTNGSVLDFLHSDYLVINEQLANHYGIAKVYGPHFRRVAITTNTHRGGILTSAAVLTMNSDGKDSHPLKRGVWLLERVLHDPPPPPPPNVPEVDLTDPEILKMTLKERIMNHRNKPACYSCHAKIDPWGIAFENFDALGVYRTSIQNKPVDASATLFNQQELAGTEGLKRYLLLDRQDQFVKAIVHKMTAYALGRPLTFSDRASLDALSTQFRKHDDRLRNLVHLIISSDLFRTKGG